MKILSAKYEDGTPITPDVIGQDMPRITHVHLEAVISDPTWEFFGGEIFIENRTYQVW